MHDTLGLCLSLILNKLCDWFRVLSGLNIWFYEFLYFMDIGMDYLTVHNALMPQNIVSFIKQSVCLFLILFSKINRFIDFLYVEMRYQITSRYLISKFGMNYDQNSKLISLARP